MNTSQPVGIFDSGIGGLSVLKEIHAILPGEDLLYFADQAHVPYGSRSLDQVRTLSEEISRSLTAQDAKVVVVACNTASAASLHYLRAIFPDRPFIGMEPAVKPAAERTKSGVVGVLATPATFQGELYASVVDRFAEGVRILQSTLPGLVEQIEAGNLEGPEVRRILEQGVEPLLERGADTLVLGCTHFPFVLETIKSVSGPEVAVIDPAPAIAQRTQQVLNKRRSIAAQDRKGSIFYTTSGDLRHFQQQLQRLDMPPGKVKQARWEQGRLHLDLQE